MKALGRRSFTLLKHFSSSSCIWRASSSSCKTCCSSPRSSLASPSAYKREFKRSNYPQWEKNCHRLKEMMKKKKTSGELKCYELEANCQRRVDYQQTRGKAADDVLERLIFLIKWSRWEWWWRWGWKIVLRFIWEQLDGGKRKCFTSPLSPKRIQIRWFLRRWEEQT